jgi:hypothetical protein
MTNCALMYRVSNAPECTTCPEDPTRWKKQVRANVPPHPFYGIPTSPHPSMKYSAPILHAPEGIKSLRDPKIAPDVKKQLQLNVSQRDFCGNRIGPTRA